MTRLTLSCQRFQVEDGQSFDANRFVDGADGGCHVGTGISVLWETKESVAHRAGDETSFCRLADRSQLMLMLASSLRRYGVRCLTTRSMMEN